MNFKKQNGTIFTLDFENCNYEIEQILNKNSELISICLKRENEIILNLNIEKNCLGIITEVLNLYDIQIKKA